MNIPTQLTAAPSPAPARTPTPSTNSSDSAKSVNNESSKAEGSGEAGNSFASTLKSQMDKKPTSNSGDGQGKQDTSSPAATDTALDDTGTPAGDVSAALLPLLVMTSALADANKQDANAQTEADPLIAPVTAETAVETTLDLSQSNLPPVLQLNATNTAAQENADTSLSDATQRNTKPDPLLPLANAKTDSSGNDTENLAVESAIAAARRPGHGDAEAGLAQGEDFRAFMDRATAMNTAQNQRTESAQSPSLRVDTPMGQAGWREEMGQKLTWMVGNNRQQAELVLTPPNLGRVEVSLTMNGDQASAVFTTANPAVREALEDSMQRLREVLATAGVTLGQTQVGAETPNQFANAEDQARQSHAGHHGVERLGNDLGLSVGSRIPGASSGRGMVDVFA
jgi:flagellar hook-length control protein FliK